MFDFIISEAQEKFHLGGQARDVLNALLRLIASAAGDGFHGFIERFCRTGSCDAVVSWIRNGDKRPISNERLEAALGAKAINSIAEETGIDRTTATTVLGFMIPRVIDALTPNGELPDEKSVLKTIKQFSGNSAANGLIGGRPAAISKFVLLISLLAVLLGIVGYFFLRIDRPTINADKVINRR